MEIEDGMVHQYVTPSVMLKSSENLLELPSRIVIVSVNLSVWPVLGASWISNPIVNLSVLLVRIHIELMIHLLKINK